MQLRIRLRVIVISGFTEPGKERLIREIANSAYISNIEDRLDILLFEMFEKDLSLPSDHDGLVVREMGGGCPCCTLEGELRKVFVASDPDKERSMVIETGGGCDLQRMRNIIQEECPSCDVACVVVMEFPYMKDILEIVPIMAENIVNADLLMITEMDGSGVNGPCTILKDVLPALAAEKDAMVGHDERIVIIPISSKGNILMYEYFGG